MALDLSSIPIRRGGMLLVHSSILRTLRTHRCRPTDYIAILLERVGPDGTLLFPLFNFDFTQGAPFDLATTPSRMGALTEAARAWPGAVRTGHPIYSFAAIGAAADGFRGLENDSGYGTDSPFARLREADGQIAVVDLPDQHAMTFYHHVEEMAAVPYRYHKRFTGSYTGADGITADRSFGLFVRDVERGVRTSVDRMGERLWDKGLYRGDRPGEATGMRIVEARALYDETAAVIAAGEAERYLYEVVRD